MDFYILFKNKIRSIGAKYLGLGLDKLIELNHLDFRINNFELRNKFNLKIFKVIYNIICIYKMKLEILELNILD